VAGFDKYLKTILARAGHEAQLDGSTTVEAQHLMLAIAADPGTAAGSALISAGLDRAAIREALNREFEHSLGTAGVSASAFDLPPATPDPNRQPHLGASVQLTLERAAKAAAGSDLQPAHLLIGILQAEVGTVPRALALTDVDRADLIARIQQTPTGQAKR
jgi:ATP-dependent Clp protease ATP-binding subunit ClpA